MKKVAIVAKNINKFIKGGEYGGGFVVAGNLMRELLERSDVELTVYTGKKLKEPLEKVRIIEIPYSKSFVDEVDTLVQNEKFDMVVSFDIPRLYKTVFLQCHSSQHKCNQCGIIQRVFRHLFSVNKLFAGKKQFREAASCKFVAVSEIIKRDYMKNFGLASERVKVIYPACKQVYETLPEMKQEECITLGIVANSSLNKGGHILLWVLGFLKMFGYKFKLKMIAPKYKKDFLMKLPVRIFGMKDMVEPLPKQSDMTDFYSNIDVLILPSRNEAFGLVVLEAMAYGKPCLVSSTAGVAEIITDKNGFVFNRKTLKAFVEKLISVINLYSEDYQTFKNYCKNAFETSRNYTWKEFTQSVLEL